MNISNYKEKKEREINNSKKDYTEEAGAYDIIGDGLSIINEQAYNSVCKIMRNDNKDGTGFLCKFPLNQFNSLPVLITCNHVLDKDYINKEKKINLKFNKENIITFNIEDSKKIYMSDKSEYDITIIEINSEDYLYNKRFLDIDDNLNKSDDLLKEKYKNENIYLIHYPNIIESKYIPKISFGQIKSICEDNYNIEHSCGTDIGSSGSPILSSKNYKVVGIHLGKFGHHFSKNGALLKIPIFKFNNIFKKISNDDIINTIYLNKYEAASYEVQNLLNISKTNVYSKYNNAKNCEIITFGDFSRVVKWYECSLRIEKIIKENIKTHTPNEYFFISPEWINKLEITFQYEQLKLYIKDFKKNNESPLTKTQIEYLYHRVKDNFFISLEKKKILKIICNNHMIQRE